MEADMVEQDTQLIADMRAGQAGLLVIDLQYSSGSRTEGLGKLLQETGREHEGAERFARLEQFVLPNVSRTLAAFRQAALPIFYVASGSQDPQFRDSAIHMRAMRRARGTLVGTRVFEILDEVRPLHGEIVLRKTSISAFLSTGLDATLRGFGVRSLLFAGVSTDLCVESTSRNAVDRGYYCYLIEDCCGATRADFHSRALDTFSSYGQVITTDLVVSLLSSLPSHSAA
jgi:nicotinamidase-related amidase